MKHLLVKFFSQYKSLSEEDIKIIEDNAIIRKYQKGAILLKEGQYAKESYLVLKGCIRSYYIIDGEEKNTDFFLEYDPLVPISYIKNQPSKYFIECLEDCVLSIGKTERTEKLLLSYPNFIPLYRKISDDYSTNQLISTDKYRNLSPEEHYLEIRKLKPELLERIPQYQLASYLGIKPQSLSRIRKRLIHQK
ncbi:Crp/Fnr family transcriptional regulator [Cyclobacterium sp. 1_MG-2023]|uniref:Crp/Fnr family transcriptional regulator n=1 Tax=Cyclobacterium sp. 1_MG-2023 TaxID=3062681 RepID=UPI0026E17E2B|nr:Crp/Fnr family transcriptional regulator [Cyclobacterium sp. 1_MG-2023]MDO6440498.1 Crp/Fnr family transcriptional regulator [Cyclobacterium sp. 1_MG-2023]